MRDKLRRRRMYCRDMIWRRRVAPSQNPEVDNHDTGGPSEDKIRDVKRMTMSAKSYICLIETRTPGNMVAGAKMAADVVLAMAKRKEEG